MFDGDYKYWYNFEIGEVEFGMILFLIDCIGFFDMEVEVYCVFEVVKECLCVWVEEEVVE